MRSPLIPLTDELKQAVPSSTIVTATARQAQELRYSWAFEAVAAGKLAWEAPNIRHFNAWVLELYEELMRKGHPSAKSGLLQQTALSLALRLCAPDDEYFKHTSAVADAWRIYCGWNLQRVGPDLDQTENGRLFRSWIREFEEFCNEQEVVTTPQLPKLIADAIRAREFKPNRACMFACDELSPSQQDLVRQLNRIGQLGESLELPLFDGPRHKVHVFKSTARERTGFVQWGRERLAQLGPESRIGVVVPQISNEYLTIRRHWEAAFFDSEDVDQLVNVGSGVPLGDTRLCQDIIKLLTWTIADLNFSEVLQLGRSPYLTALEIPTQFPRDYPDHIRFAGYASRSSSGASKQINRLTTRRPSLLSDWASVALQVFRAAGWSTDKDSDEDRRIHASIVDVLNSVSHLSAFVGRVSWSQAVEYIRDGVRSAQLAYNTRNSPIQVVDRSESVGLQFDALWVCSVAEDKWPPDPNPNPMIPISVQRRAVMPRVTHQQMLGWAQLLTRVWACSAPEVVFSAAPMEDQTEALPSRLLMEHDRSDINRILSQSGIAEFDHPWGVARQQHMVREFIADKGTPLPPEEVSEQRTSVIRDQSNCPFRAWAIHRAKLPESKHPHRFPDPLDRGTAVHKVMQLLVERARDRGAILELDSVDIEMAIDSAVAPLRKMLLPDRFIEYEKARIREIVNSWQELERSREDFQIVDVEREYLLDLEGFSFKLRVDRVDKTGELKALVIDYKTGTVRIRNWSTPRPLDPQMPLYSMVVPNCDGLAYEEISGSDVKLRGVSDRSTSEDGIKLASKQLDVSLSALKNDWRTALSTIVLEFKEGLATVKPTNVNFICRNCHLDGFCRTFTDIDMPVIPEVEVE